MERIENIDEAKRTVLDDMNHLIDSLRKYTESDILSVSQGSSRLRNIRLSVSESLNQIQHEYLILQGLLWLKERGYEREDIQWYWNPRQTGDSTEPDLRGAVDNAIVISAEATTSEKPQGVIDSRMRDTLDKLNQMDGEKYYFIRTSQMEQRANTKVTKKGWGISVVRIEN